MLGISRLMIRVASKPFMVGIVMSIRITSGRYPFALVTASAPSAPSQTTSMSGYDLRSLQVLCRTISSSSTTMILSKILSPRSKPKVSGPRLDKDRLCKGASRPVGFDRFRLVVWNQRNLTLVGTRVLKIRVKSPWETPSKYAFALLERVAAL